MHVNVIQTCITMSTLIVSSIILSLNKLILRSPKQANAEGMSHKIIYVEFSSLKTDGAKQMSQRLKTKQQVVAAN